MASNTQLLIDLGNTALKCRLCQQSDLSAKVIDFYLTYADSISWSDQLSEFLRQYKFNQVVIASVAESYVLQSVEQVLDIMDKSISKTVLQTVRQFGQVINGYKQFQQLGVDRWLALLAVRQMLETSAVIIDAGSALKIDLLRQDGLHLGGAILPGLHTSEQRYRQILQRFNFDESQEIDISQPALSTASAIQLGYALHGNFSLDDILDRWMHLLSSPVAIIITGGDRQEVSSQLTRQSKCIDDLVFRGMLIQICSTNETTF